MDTQQEIFEMLELMTAPAFCAKNGKVDQLNLAAQQLMLQSGTPLAELLGNQISAYQAFDSGCLFVALDLCGFHVGATVNRIGNTDIFVIDQQAQAELRIMSLVANDLRLPLADVLTLTDRVLPTIETQANDEQKEHIRQINRKLTQLNRAILNMADAARYSAEGTKNLQLQNAVAVIQDVLDHAKVLLDQTQVSLQVQLPQDTIMCQLDREKLERAIYNLLANAVKASLPNGTVHVSLHQRNGWLHLTVQDNGTGVASGIMGNVFSRYHRHAGIEDCRNGLGLGMVMVRSAAMTQGGTVLLQQPPEGGTKVSLSFPIQTGTDLTVRSPMLTTDYAGFRDHGLLELSEVLPSELYTYKP